MDPRDRLQRMMRKEFGHLLNAAQVKTVTVTAVDLSTRLATVTMAQGDPLLDVQPDPQDVIFLDSYTPQVNDIAYMILGEGSPVLIGAKELETWHDLTLPSGYSTTSPFRTPAYRKDNQGRVWFKGACNVAASNAAGTKFTLPTGYRPTTKTWIAAPVSNGTSISSTFPGMRYDVNTDGTIVTLVASPAAIQIFSFEGLSFDTRP
jgi:hypothetical protein